MIFAQKRFRDGTGITQGRNSFGCNSSLGAFFIHHNADDFDVVGQIDLLEHLLAIGHLRNDFGRNKTHSVDVLKARRDQCAEVARLEFSRDLPFETLPGVSRAFDQFDSIPNHGNVRRLFEKFLRALEETLSHWSIFFATKRCEFLKFATLFRI